LAKRSEECGMHRPRKFCLFIIQVAARRGEAGACGRATSQYVPNEQSRVVKHVAERRGLQIVYACATRISIQNSAGWLAGGRTREANIRLRSLLSSLEPLCAFWPASPRKRERCVVVGAERSQGYPRFCSAVSHATARRMTQLKYAVCRACAGD
jgi:hypothetical protein